jgi:peptidyl-prolyl cis-trans isomerase A (cyclophilin A)
MHALRSFGYGLTAFLWLSCCAGAETARAADDPRVAIETRFGTIEVEVYPQRAPLSACDFLAYVTGGLYEGATFYRVVRVDNDRGTPKIEVIQGGLPDDAQHRPPVAHETTQVTGLKHVDGALSLARGPIGTGSAAAFFIVIGAQPARDFGGERNADRQGFAVFGRVVQGMDIVRRIHALPANTPTDEPYLKAQLLSEPVAITRATLTRGNTRACKSTEQTDGRPAKSRPSSER